MMHEPTKTFYLVRMQDGRHVISDAANFLKLKGAAGVLERTVGESWQEARERFSSVVRLPMSDVRPVTQIKGDIPTGDALFKSSHAALIFAFNYAGQQSPKTPLTTLLRISGNLRRNGKGLGGLDGAAQAGMILRALNSLAAVQRQVLIVRYGDFRHTCLCCGQPAPSADWREAVDSLSHCNELEGIPRIVRHAAIERAICRRQWDSKRLSQEYGLSDRTLRDQVKRLKERLSRIENAGLTELDGWLRDGGVVGDCDRA